MALSDMEKGLIALVIVGGGLYFLTGGFQLGAAPGVPSPVGPGYATTLRFSTWIPYHAFAAPSNVNFRIYSSADSPVVTETLVNANPMTQGTMPNSLDGYIMVGNDNGLGTDRGSDVYYTKKAVKYTNDPAPDIGTIVMYNESSITWRGYDSGVEETLPNITIASGASYTRLELEMEAGDNACIGNPDFKKIAVGFNFTSSAVLAKFDWVRPKSGWYTGTDIVPDYTVGTSFLPTIYILPSSAFVCDYGTYRFPLDIQAKAAADPGVDEYTFAHVFDWTYYLDDSGKIMSGWEDKSDVAADADIGIGSFALAKAITFA